MYCNMLQRQKLTVMRVVIGELNLDEGGVNDCEDFSGEGVSSKETPWDSLAFCNLYDPQAPGSSCCFFSTSLYNFVGFYSPCI